MVCRKSPELVTELASVWNKRKPRCAARSGWSIRTHFQYDVRRLAPRTPDARTVSHKERRRNVAAVRRAAVFASVAPAKTTHKYWVTERAKFARPRGNFHPLRG